LRGARRAVDDRSVRCEGDAALDAMDDSQHWIFPSTHIVFSTPPRARRLDATNVHWEMRKSSAAISSRAEHFPIHPQHARRIFLSNLSCSLHRCPTLSAAHGMLELQFSAATARQFGAVKATRRDSRAALSEHAAGLVGTALLCQRCH
jgi:hypothetical protein